MATGFWRGRAVGSRWDRKALHPGSLRSIQPPARRPLCCHRPAPVSLWHQLSLRSKCKSPSLERISLVASVASVSATLVACQTSRHLRSKRSDPWVQGRVTPSCGGRFPLGASVAQGASCCHGRRPGAAELALAGASGAVRPLGPRPGRVLGQEPWGRNGRAPSVSGVPLFHALRTLA